MNRIALNWGGLQRRYLLFAPRQPRAILVFLHGKGSTADWADDETGWSHTAQREGFALALPEGLPPDTQAAPTFLNNPPGWNDGSAAQNFHLPYAPDRPNLSENRDDVGFLDAVLDHVSNQLGNHSLPVCLSGFSNGAGMTFRYAAERSERLAAIAPVAGLCWVRDARLVRPLPTLYMIGDADPLVPLRGGPVVSPWTNRLSQRPSVAETLERWALVIGCQEAPTVESDADGVRTDIYPGPVSFRAVEIAGLGHHWPGGKGRLNPRIAGAPSRRVNANELIWRFFEQLIGAG